MIIDINDKNITKRKPRTFECQVLKISFNSNVRQKILN